MRLEPLKQVPPVAMDTLTDRTTAAQHTSRGASVVQGEHHTFLSYVVIIGVLTACVPSTLNLITRNSATIIKQAPYNKKSPLR